MRVSEKTLRSAISHILSERMLDEPITQGSYGGQQGKITKQSPEEFGKKFSYEKDGEPQFLLIAKTVGGTNIGLIYSAATITDPVSRNLGRLLSKAEIEADWDWVEYITKTGLVDNFEEIVSTTPYDPQRIAKEIYSKLHIFVPLKMERPKFESTVAAQVKANSGECSISKESMKDELVRFNSMWQSNSVSQADIDQQALRLTNCLKAWTQDSFSYSLAQLVAVLLTGVTVAFFTGPGAPAAAPISAAIVDTAMDAIPGGIIAGMYFALGKKQQGAQALITTVIYICLPTFIAKIAEKFGINTVKQFLLGVIGVGILSKLSSLVTEYMFGNDYGLTQSEFTTAINSTPDMNINDFIASHQADYDEMTAPGDFLRKIYPNM
jgi:hypothetical protein